MQTIDEAKLYHTENLLCGVGMIYKELLAPDSYSTGIYFLNTRIYGALLKTSPIEQKFDCSSLPFFIGGNIWKKDKSVDQNITLQRPTAKIVIPKNFNGQAKSLAANLIEQSSQSGNKYLIDKVHTQLFEEDILMHPDTMYAYFITVKYKNINYLFPCSEIARKYVFKSSSIAKAVITNTLVNMAQKIEIINIDNKRIGRFSVAEHFTDEEIQELAPLILDENWSMIHKKISSQIQGAFTPIPGSTKVKTKTYYRTSFPSTDKFNMEVCGKPFALNGKDYFMVYQILSEDSEKHLCYDCFQAERIISTSESNTSTQSQSGRKAMPKIKHKTKNQRPDITAEEDGNSNSLTKKFNLKIEVTDTFKHDSPPGDILKENDLGILRHQEKTTVINRDTSTFNISDTVSQDSKNGRAKALVDEDFFLRDELLILVMALDLLKETTDAYGRKKYDINIIDLTSDEESKPYNTESLGLLSQLKYILVSIHYNYHYFYLLSFNNKDLDSRDVIIYRTDGYKISQKTLQRIVGYISYIQIVPPPIRFRNWIKGQKENFDLERCNISRMNHTQSTFEDQKEKLEKKIHDLAWEPGFDYNDSPF